LSGNRHNSFGSATLTIFVVAFALRMVHIWQIRETPLFSVLLGDARVYDEWAQRIAGGDWIGREVFYQAPLYPYFLGLIYRLAGRSLMLVRIAQAVIGSCSCVLVAAAARRLFSAPAGLAAGLMLAVYAPAIFFDSLIQKSVLDVFFVCMALWLIARILSEPPKAWSWLALGLAVGALSLTRENALAFIVVILGWAVLRFGWRAAAVFTLGVAAMLLPVIVRNSIVGGGFYITTAQLGPNFFIGNHPGANGTYQSLRYGRGDPEYEQRDATDLAQYALHRLLTPAEVSSYWMHRAFDFIISDPGAWLKLIARKATLLGNATEMADTEDQATYSDYSMVLRLLGPVTHFGVFVPLALVGILAAWTDRRRLGIFYALLVAYSGSVLLFYVVARYRYPLVPILMLFAGAGVAAGTQAFARAVFPVQRLTLPAATVVAVAVFANWPMNSVSAMRAVTETNLGAALQNDRLDDAIVHYRRAISIQPDYAPAYNDLGVALREQKRIGEATESYQKALKLQPEFATAHYNFANLLLDQGDPAAAIDHFQRAMQREPASADVHNNFGIALASSGRIDEAVSEFRRAIDLDPSSAKAYRNLGDVLSARNRPAEAISALRRAVDLAPNDAAVRYDLASALLEIGSFREAIPEFRETLRLAPAMADAHNNLGIALGSDGKLDEAIEEFRRALAIQPGLASARQNLDLAVAARNAGSK
jgi:tetratricopeptide (TPR) repeat protein